jgi:hypothetical protein
MQCKQFHSTISKVLCMFLLVTCSNTNLILLPLKSFFLSAREIMPLQFCLLSPLPCTLYSLCSKLTAELWREFNSRFLISVQQFIPANWMIFVTKTNPYLASILLKTKILDMLFLVLIIDLVSSFFHLALSCNIYQAVFHQCSIASLFTSNTILHCQW